METQFPVSNFVFQYLQMHTRALFSLHAVVPPVDDVEADEVEREEHQARLIDPEARDAFATTSIIT